MDNLVGRQAEITIKASKKVYVAMYKIGDRLSIEWFDGSAVGTVDHYELDDQERLTYYMIWEDNDDNGPYTMRDLVSLQAAKVLTTA